jgi:hypothetical protein
MEEARETVLAGATLAREQNRGRGMLDPLHPEGDRLHRGALVDQGVKRHRAVGQALGLGDELLHVEVVPRFLVTDALHWESGRVIETWSYRWASEIFHEFGKQVTGLESAQVRKEEAVNRHFRLSGVAQSIVQRAPSSESTSER